MMAYCYKDPPEPWELLKVTATCIAEWFRCKIVYTITMPSGDTATETIDRLRVRKEGA